MSRNAAIQEDSRNQNPLDTGVVKDVDGLEKYQFKH